MRRKIQFKKDFKGVKEYSRYNKKKVCENLLIADIFHLPGSQNNGLQNPGIFCVYNRKENAYLKKTISAITDSGN